MSGQPTFVHAAEVRLAEGADENAPGAAVTVALCGHWEHEGACRWPHLTTLTARDGDRRSLRTVFACPADDEPEVRRRLRAGLGSGTVAGPNGLSAWTVELEEQPVPSGDDLAWGARQTG